MRSHAASIRFRLTAVATLVVAVVLAITAVGLITVQRHQLTRNLDASLERRADELIEVFGDDLSTVSLALDDEDRAVQVTDPDGRVLTASANLVDADGIDALDDSQDQVIRTRDDLPLDDGLYRVLSRRITTTKGPAILHVIESIDDLDDAIRALAVTLTAGIPVVVAALAALMWWLTGRTLRPVDRMRTQVDDITVAQTDQRIDVPERDDEITRLAVTMNRMLDRLDDAAARQRRFVADAAHELRTPLTRIRTNVEVDLAQPDRADPTDTNSAIRDEAIGLQYLIDDLLHLARSDAGERAPRRQPVDLDDILLGEVREQRSIRPDLTIDTTGISAAHCDANPDQLRRAIRNLLGNAAGHARSTIGLTLEEVHGRIELAVTDDGPGVAEADRERIFERFARVDDARARLEGGTGLGLAITRDIVEAHGGTITCTASDTGGARFVVRLPAGPTGHRRGDRGD